MRLRYLGIALLVAAGCRELPDIETGPDAAIAPRVRIGTFNVRRFFDTVCDSGTCGFDAYEELPTASAFDARADQLADAIAQLGVDVIALEEVETQACLDALTARLGGVMPYGVLGEISTPASVDVAVLSRTPIDEVLRHRDAQPLTRPDGTPTTFSRELLEVHVRAATGEPIVVFAAHFKSKSDDDPGRRLAEAQVARAVVDARAAAEPTALVVLGGDLNDTPGSPPLNALTGNGGLVRVADDLPLSEQVTYRYGGQGQAIDHLLLAPTAAALRVPLSTRAWSDDRGWGGSDHHALTSTFWLQPP